MSLFRRLGRQVEQFRATAKQAAEDHEAYQCTECGARFSEGREQCPECGAGEVRRVERQERQE